MDARRRIPVFRLRAFISLLNVLSFLAMSLSGVILYIAPSGRRAGDWYLWTLSRDQWIALHLCFSAVFLLAALVHLWLNRRPLLHYLKMKTKTAARLRWEWLAVLLLTGLVTWASLRPFEPFASLIRWRDRFHRGVISGQTDPESERAGSGQITLEAYCRQIGMDVDRALETLKKDGIVARKTDTLRSIADRAGLHPGRIRRLLDDAHP